MKRRIAIVVILLALVSGIGVASLESSTQDSRTALRCLGLRYMPCDNYSGPGIYWIDTTSGKIWNADIGKEILEWRYVGQLKDAKVGAVGTYVPYTSPYCEGLFILDTVTGEGWWTNGREWKHLGKPAAAVEAKGEDSKDTLRYMPCMNYSESGFYWVDTASGKIWSADIGVDTGGEKMTWRYMGQVKDAKTGVIGTYIPYASPYSMGVFVFNAVTGEGWWTNGREWKTIKVP